MNVQLLIDSIVRQTTVLIAQLATRGGIRAPLAHVANQVFVDLATELNNQGVSRKVSADMFGMALRSYLRKIQRLGESLTDRGRPLSQAMLDFLKDGRIATRREILERFHRDDDATVRAVLHDLCESGLVFRSGTGEGAAYRGATQAELEQLSKAAGTRIDELLWVIVYRNGPIQRDALDKLAGGDAGAVDAALERLSNSGRIQRDEADRYRASEFYVPLGSPVGWEASVFDHFQAMVQTICARLADDGDSTSASRRESGGSTYTLDVWPGHPLEEEARGTLNRVREELSSLRARVEAHNKTQARPAEFDAVVFYCGQCAIRQETNAPGSDPQS